MTPLHFSRSEPYCSQGVLSRTGRYWQKLGYRGEVGFDVVIPKRIASSLAQCRLSEKLHFDNRLVVLVVEAPALVRVARMLGVAAGQ